MYLCNYDETLQENNQNETTNSINHKNKTDSL